jgi:hypothetical protein
MATYIRLWNCGVCDEPVTYDSEGKIINCKCGPVEQVEMPLKTLLESYKRITRQRK